MKKISISIITILTLTSVVFGSDTFYKNGKWITHSEDCQSYFKDSNMIGWAAKTEGSSTCGCREGFKMNQSGNHCLSKEGNFSSTPTEENNQDYKIDSNNLDSEKLKGERCSSDLILHQDLKAPRYGERYIRNGKYHWYTKETVREAHILQKHLNRLGFNAGKVDGVIGPNTKGAILRLQAYLGTKQDGYVGPKTRALLNNSCGESFVAENNNWKIVSAKVNALGEDQIELKLREVNELTYSIYINGKKIPYTLISIVPTEKKYNKENLLTLEIYEFEKYFVNGNNKISVKYKNQTKNVFINYGLDEYDGCQNIDTPDCGGGAVIPKKRDLNGCVVEYDCYNEMWVDNKEFDVSVYESNAKKCEIPKNIENPIGTYRKITKDEIKRYLDYYLRESVSGSVNSIYGYDTFEWESDKDKIIDEYGGCKKVGKILKAYDYGVNAWKAEYECKNYFDHSLHKFVPKLNINLSSGNTVVNINDNRVSVLYYGKQALEITFNNNNNLNLDFYKRRVYPVFSISGNEYSNIVRSSLVDNGNYGIYVKKVGNNIKYIVTDGCEEKKIEENCRMGTKECDNNQWINYNKDIISFDEIRKIKNSFKELKKFVVNKKN